MRVLILSQFFDPEPTLKGMTFARELQRRGHVVEVLTGFPNYPSGKLYRGYKLRLWHRQTVEGVRINRVFLYPSHDRSAVRRLLNYISFAISASLIGPWLIKRPDAMFVYHPPPTISLAARVIRFVTGAPYIYEIQDIWPDSVASSGMLSNKPLLRLLGIWCKRVYAQADQIVVISAGFKRLLTERGIAAERIEIVYNWCDEDRIKLTQADELQKQQFGFSSGFNVLFAGNMGMAQSLDAVLDAAKLLTVRVPNATILLLGAGVDRDRLMRRAKEFHIENVRFLAPRPITEMGSILPLADALLVHLKDDPLFSVTIPSKTQAYMYAGVPIIMAVQGDGAEIITRAGCGVTCEPENPEAIAHAVEIIARMSPHERKRMGEAGRKAYQREMSVAVGGQLYAALFKEITQT